MLAAAGGSLSVLFPLSSSTASTADKNIDTWQVIDAVQQHLFPTEEQAPGATEINALGYLKFIVTDTTIDSPAVDATVECDGAGNTTDLNNWLNNNGGATSSDQCSGSNVTWTNDYTPGNFGTDCGAAG